MLIFCLNIPQNSRKIFPKCSNRARLLCVGGARCSMWVGRCGFAVWLRPSYCLRWPYSTTHNAPGSLPPIGGRCSFRCARPRWCGCCWLLCVGWLVGVDVGWPRWWLLRSCSVSAGWLPVHCVTTGAAALCSGCAPSIAGRCVASVIDGGRCSMWIGRGGGVALVPALCRLAGSRCVVSPPARLALFRVWPLLRSCFLKYALFALFSATFNAFSATHNAPGSLPPIGGRCSFRCARPRWWLLRSCSVSAGWFSVRFFKIGAAGSVPGVAGCSVPALCQRIGRGGGRSVSVVAVALSDVRGLGGVALVASVVVWLFQVWPLG